MLSLFLVLVMVIGQGAGAALAIPGDPLDPDPIDSEPPFSSPANGFNWSVPSRFGNYVNGMVDYHYDPSTSTYDPNYVRPQNFPVNFDGCQTQEESNTGVSANTYRWDLVRGTTVEPIGAASNACTFRYAFSAQGSYTVRLTITRPDGTTSSFEQAVVVRDYLIVSIGDSFASGEGNPDVLQRVEATFPVGWRQVAPARWQDTRCHRSAYAGPAQAALGIEAADPQTSVTFLSFACSGATIDTPGFAPNGLDTIVDALSPDPYKPLGTGILGDYRGAEVPDGFGYDRADFLPSQIAQVKAAVGNRPIDALIISGGGNDVRFGDVAQACLATGECWNNAYVMESPGNGPFLLQALVDRAFRTLPGKYDALAAAIDANLNVTQVYITEYPDLTRADDGDYCQAMLDDIFAPNPFPKLDYDEARWAEQSVLNRLNTAVANAAGRHGWVYVGGIKAEFSGHGYCASDNWIRRADESETYQGPVNLRLANKGTLHPTARGHQVYKKYLLQHIVLDNGRPNAAPSFGAAYTSAALTSRPGANGWFTGVCDGSSCTSDKVALQVTAADDTAVRGASVSINGTPVTCAVNTAFPGGTCTAQATDGGKGFSWRFNFTADGHYRLQFAAQDDRRQVANFAHEMKVDLRDPAFTAPQLGPFNVAEGGTVGLTAAASDAGGGPVSLQWDLDNDGTFETSQVDAAGAPAVFRAGALDGPDSRTIGVRVRDRAGRTTSSTATVNITNTVPAPAIVVAPATSPEGTAIHVIAAATDPSAADTSAGFTYAWNVTKNGSPFAAGSGAGFSFAPDDNGAYAVGLTATDKDGGAGVTSTTIAVTNVASAATFQQSASVNEGSPFTLSLVDPVDPSSVDTAAGFQYAFDCGTGTGYGAFGVSSAASCATNDDGTRTAQGKIRDKDGGISEYTTTVTINNVDPTAAINGAPVTWPEGTAIVLTSTVSDPGSADTHTYAWSVTKNGTPYTLPAGANVAGSGFTFTPDDDGTYVVSLVVTDDDRGTDSDSTTIAVTNVIPTAAIVGPAAGSVYAVNTDIAFAGAYSDPGMADTHTAQWTLSSEVVATPVTCPAIANAGTVSGSCRLTQAGIYKVRLTATDDDGGAGTATTIDGQDAYIVVYDPSAGFVTGGGWIASPAGAYRPDPALAGRASFGFVSKYQKGADKPTGQTEFQFQAGNFRFNSTSYQWLVVSGARAQYKGVGFVNGDTTRTYGFLLTATDGQISGGGGADKFRIKVWDTTTNTVVYDNVLDTTATDDLDGANPQVIGGGSIVIHNGK